MKLYRQEATHFTMRFVLRGDATVEGRFVLELADTFIDRLVFPGCVLASLWTKAPGMNRKMNIGDFSERRWRLARTKIGANACEALRLEAHTADFPGQTIALSVQANPPGRSENLKGGTIAVTCSVPYLRHLAASPAMIDALLELGTSVWNGTRSAYGFANLAIIPRRAGVTPFAMGGPPDLALTAPPATRAHEIPVAQTGNDIDGNLDELICQGRGIKGAYWANYLSAGHVAMAGGESSLRARLASMQIEPISEGLLIVAIDSPLPADTEENRERFVRLEAALKPAFLSRAETPANKRELLGYFFREDA